MGVKKGQNNFAAHQAEAVQNTVKLLEAELKDVRNRAGVKFEDLDALVRYASKVTGIHRTTLKRNATYRRLLRAFLARQPGAVCGVKIDDASPELLRSMVEDRDLTIGNLTNQMRALKIRLDKVELAAKALPAPESLPTAAVTDGAQSDQLTGDAAFQDTAFALLQLIQHLNKTASAETIVIDEDAGLILDMAITNPRRRREMAIGPERTKPFIAWLKANRKSLEVG